jgi:hypothetical protein
MAGWQENINLNSLRQQAVNPKTNNPSRNRMTNCDTGVIQTSCPSARLTNVLLDFLFHLQYFFALRSPLLAMSIITEWIDTGFELKP